MCFSSLSGMLISPNGMSLEFFCHAYNWSSYSDLTRPGRPKCSFLEGKSPGNQRLVKYYDLGLDVSSSLGHVHVPDSRRFVFKRGCFSRIWGEGSNQSTILFQRQLTEKLNMAIFQPAMLVYRSVHHPRCLENISCCSPFFIPTPAGIKTT